MRTSTLLLVALGLIGLVLWCAHRVTSLAKPATDLVRDAQAREIEFYEQTLQRQFLSDERRQYGDE